MNEPRPGILPAAFFAPITTFANRLARKLRLLRDRKLVCKAGGKFATGDLHNYPMRRDQAKDYRLQCLPLKVRERTSKRG